MKRVSLPILLLLSVALLTGACGRMGDPIVPGQEPLPQPEGLVARGRETGLTLAWAAPSRSLAGGPGEITAYIVERQDWRPGEDPCLDCPAEYEEVANLDVVKRETRGSTITSWNDSSVEEGWQYRYRVSALNRFGRRGLASLPILTSFHRVESPKIKIVSIDGGLRVIFTPPPLPLKTSHEGLFVYGEGGTVVAKMQPGMGEGKILGLENNTPVTFDFRWAVVSPHGWRMESPPLVKTVAPTDLDPPLPPRELAAFPDGENIRLMWIVQPGEGYDKVVIFRGPAGEELKEVATVEGKNTIYIDEEVMPGVTYIYGCMGIDRAGNRSELSPLARIKVVKR